MPTCLEVLIYRWPDSQHCMSCKHGEAVDSKTFAPCCYICWEGCKKNDGVICPKFEKDI